MFASVTFAQTGSDDMETWTSVRLRYKASKKWSFELQEQLRLKENSSVTDQYFTQLTSKYRLTKKLALGLGLRYIKRNDNQGGIQGFEDYFRYHFDLSFKHSIDRFTFNHRLRYQNKNRQGNTNKKITFAKKNLRLKSSITYNIRKWKLDPRVSAEIFYQPQSLTISSINLSDEDSEDLNYDDYFEIINDAYDEIQDAKFRKYRLTLGTSYDMDRAGEISLYYRMEKELNTSLPKKVAILGVNYTYTLNN